MRRILNRAGFAAPLIAALLLTACDDDSPTEVDVDEEVSAASVRRLVVADLAQPRLHLVDPEGGRVLQSIATTAPVSGLYATETRRFAFALQSAANRGDIVDGGVWSEDHGDHAHLHESTAGALSFGLTGPTPIHWFSNDGWVATFFDGDGSAQFVRESDLYSGSYRSTTVASGGPQHGAVLAMGGAFLITSPDRAQPTSLPDSVKVYGTDGGWRQSFGDCPDIHGDAANTRYAAFGCTDGVLLIEHAGGTFAARKIPASGDLAGLGGVRAVLGRAELPFFVGRLGNATVRRLAKIDPAAGTMTAIQVPGSYPLAWEVDPTGRRLVVLDESGSLSVIDLATGATEGTVAGVVGAIAVADRSRAPSIAVAEELTYLTSPATGEVLVIDHVARAVRSRISVGGAPGRLALLGPARDVRFSGEH